MPTSKNHTNQIDFLRTVPLFEGLADDHLAALAEDFRLKEYERDEVIFRQGDTNRELYIIFSGRIRIFRLSPGGAETSIIIFGRRAAIGEFATIDRKPRSATAKAIVPTQLLQMSEATFLQRLDTLPGLGLSLARMLVGKIRWTAAYAEAVAQYDAAGRLLHILLLYNERFGEAIEPGRRYTLDLGLTQTDLASLIGARREWVNRLLAKWKERNLIEFDHGAIIILDLPEVIAERNSRIEANRGDW